MHFTYLLTILFFSFSQAFGSGVSEKAEIIEYFKQEVNNSKNPKFMRIYYKKRGEGASRKQVLGEPLDLDKIEPLNNVSKPPDLDKVGSLVEQQSIEIPMNTKFPKKVKYVWVDSRMKCNARDAITALKKRGRCHEKLHTFKL